jgi:hypothetical protein
MYKWGHNNRVTVQATFNKMENINKGSNHSSSFVLGISKKQSGGD